MALYSMAYTVIAYIIVMAVHAWWAELPRHRRPRYIVMACMAMAYTVIAYMIVMAIHAVGPNYLVIDDLGI